MTQSNTVIAVLDDLFFNVKIADAAKRAGFQVVFVKTPDAAKERLHEAPALVVIDLNCSALDPIQLVSEIKSGEFRQIPVIGYVSHVQVELRQKAQDAGCDVVLARSSVDSKLPQILAERRVGTS